MLKQHSKDTFYIFKDALYYNDIIHWSAKWNNRFMCIHHIAPLILKWMILVNRNFIAFKDLLEKLLEPPIFLTAPNRKLSVIKARLD